METLTYGQWLKNQTSKLKYKDSIYKYLEHCKNYSIKLPDDLRIQILNEISEKPEARDELQKMMADRVSILAADNNGACIKKSIIYFDWLKLFNLNDDSDQRVEFVKFCKLNNLFLSDELTIFYLRFDEKESVSSEADYMMWQLNDDASLLIEAAAGDHEDAVHALANIMDFGGVCLLKILMQFFLKN
jgi:hypothetical protein